MTESERGFTFEGSDVSRVLADLAAGWEILPSQQPEPTTWSPEKRLAGAVLASGLINLDIDWINSDDMDWPFSFLRLCESFSLEPQWVRKLVAARGNSLHAAAA